MASENETVSLFTDQNAEKLDLLEAIEELPLPYKESIILFYYYDMSLQEIALILKILINTVKTHLNRGRKQLLKLLGRSYFDGQKHIL